LGDPVIELALALGFRRDEWIIASPRRFNFPTSHSILTDNRCEVAGGIKQNIGELCGDLAYPRRPGALRDPEKAHIFAKLAGFNCQSLYCHAASVSYCALSPAQDMKALVEAMMPQLEKSLSIICVDRSIRPLYPYWVKMVMHPDLEATGADTYDLATIEPWLHERQKNGGKVVGNRIYEHLLSNSMLDSCLGLRDGEEIQNKGIAVFRKFFGGKALFLWKSVVADRGDGFHVPFLTELGDEG
jgi:hypothetical protein